jgi:hypothetical protein
MPSHLRAYLRELRKDFSNIICRLFGKHQVGSTNPTRREVMYPGTIYKSTDDLLNGIRGLLVPLRDTERELTSLDIHRLVFDSRAKLPDIGFRYGSPLPYSERLEDLIHILLTTGELEISRRNSCNLIVTKKLNAPSQQQASPTRVDSR